MCGFVLGGGGVARSVAWLVGMAWKGGRRVEERRRK